MKSAEVYNITANQFIPAVQVLRYSFKEPKLFVNEEDLYEMYYYITLPDQTTVNVTAINCDEYITKYLSGLHSKQIESILAEMYDKAEEYKCPDIATIRLWGSLASTEI